MSSDNGRVVLTQALLNDAMTHYGLVRSMARLDPTDAEAVSKDPVVRLLVWALYAGNLIQRSTKFLDTGMTQDEWAGLMTDLQLLVGAKPLQLQPIL